MGLKIRFKIKLLYIPLKLKSFRSHIMLHCVTLIMQVILNTIKKLIEFSLSLKHTSCRYIGW